MAFSKASMVFLVLMVGAIMANARRFETESAGPICECTTEDYVTKCHLRFEGVGRCPTICRNLCGCTKMIPPTCWCTFDVDTCSDDATHLVDFLALKRNY